MPVGAPSYRPDPKSGWAVLAAPIVATQAAELAESGSWSTGVFQILSAGRTGQLPMAGDWAVALQTLSRTNPRANKVDGEGRNIDVASFTQIRRTGAKIPVRSYLTSGGYKRTPNFLQGLVGLGRS